MKEPFNILKFFKNVAGKRLILFGAASSGKMAAYNFMEKGIAKKDILFYDNNPQKWGKEIIGIKVLSLKEFIKIPRQTPIIISSTMHEEIKAQLKKLHFTNIYYSRALLSLEHALPKYDDVFIRLLDEIRDRCNMFNEEKYTLYSIMKSVSKLKGDVAEVGVYKGGSARILCEEKGKKEIHLFDTFEGLPKESIAEDDLVKPGWLSDVDFNEVKSFLGRFSNVFFYKGLFPQTAGPIKNKKFCLVHLDTDTYKSTLDGLKFFWPRMTISGKIVSHDYNNVDCPGVKRAFKEFFKDHPEMIIEIADTQALVVKYELNTV